MLWGSAQSPTLYYNLEGKKTVCVIIHWLLICIHSGTLERGIQLSPWPSFVSVSSFPANTGKGLLGSWGAGTRFQLHTLMYRNPLLGPCWGHRCTICTRAVKTQPVCSLFTFTGVAALPGKTFKKRLAVHLGAPWRGPSQPKLTLSRRKKLCTLSIRNDPPRSCSTKWQAAKRQHYLYRLVLLYTPLHWQPNSINDIQLF